MLHNLQTVRCYEILLQICQNILSNMPTCSDKLMSFACKLALSGWKMMIYFSAKHNPYCDVPSWNVLFCDKIFHEMFYGMSLSLSFQTKLLNSVLALILMFVNVWLLNLVLKGPLVNPKNVSALKLVFWLPFKGHSAWFLQLQVLCSSFLGFEKMDLLRLRIRQL